MQLLDLDKPYAELNREERQLAKALGAQLSRVDVDERTGHALVLADRRKRAASLPAPVASRTSGRPGDLLLATISNPSASNIRKLAAPTLTKGMPKWCPRCGQPYHGLCMNPLPPRAA